MEFKPTMKEILFALLLIVNEMKWNFVSKVLREKQPIQQKPIILALMK